VISPGTGGSGGRLARLRSPGSIALLELFLALGAVACVPTTVPASREVTMRVELDAFSGRPNPVWDLTAAQAQELFTRLESLPKGGGGTVRDGLGYRGIIVTANAGQIAGFDRIVVSYGVVLGERAGGDQSFRDANRDLERWLFHTGRGRLEAAVYSMIAQELGP
jgi:hypothetical protein